MGRESAKLREIRISGARYLIRMRSFMFAKDVEDWDRRHSGGGYIAVCCVWVEKSGKERHPLRTHRLIWRGM